MNFCLVNSDGIIENIIVCKTPEIAAEFGALKSYDGASIGTAYNPPPPPPSTEERVLALENENERIKTQIKMQAQQQEFLENCILEMGDIVYA